MIGESRRLVTDEPVEVGGFRKFTDHCRGIFRICPQFHEGKPEDVNMLPVGLADTGISADEYA
jgi:hypothetical protein